MLSLNQYLLIMLSTKRLWAWKKPKVVDVPDSTRNCWYYQCPSTTSATRPPNSRWYWPCLPKEVSKFQGEWSLKFKIYCQLRIKGPQNKVRDPWGQGLFALVGPSLWNTLSSAVRSIQCSGFQAGSKDLLTSFGICPLNQLAYSDCDVLFSFSLSICHV